MWVALVAVAVGSTACSRVPDPFIYYPGLSYPELEAIDPDSAHAMRQSYVDNQTEYLAEEAHLQVVEPHTRKVIIDIDNVTVTASSDLFQTGNLEVRRNLAVPPDTVSGQIRSLTEQLGKSGWRCIDGPDPLQARNPRFTHVIECLNLDESPPAKLNLRLGPDRWQFNVLSRRSERCKRTPPRYQYECRGDLHDEF